MRLAKLRTIIVGCMAVGGTIASLAIRHHARLESRDRNEISAQQVHQLAELVAANQRLVAQAQKLSSNQAVPTTIAAPNELIAELAQLQAQADALRKQTNQLMEQLAENRRSWAARTASRFGSNTFASGSSFVSVASDSNSQEYLDQLAKMAYATPHSSTDNNNTLAELHSLSSAVSKYAREHKHDFPSNLDQLSPYLDKDKPLPSTEFELLYQGSLNELTNIPAQAVAVIRERQPWPTPNGKWARIYLNAHGWVEIVESDDSFQSYEAEHVIPPPAVSQ